MVKLIFFNETVTCTFLNLAKEDSFVKSCEISYGPISHCTNLSSRNTGGPTVLNQVSIQLQLTSSISSYCYLLKANHGSKSITINGTFMISK